MPDISVEPYVVLYAIRYGLPRFSYAHSDAINLAIEYAPALAGWADTLIRDIDDSAVPVRPFGGCRDGLCLTKHEKAKIALADHSRKGRED